MGDEYSRHAAPCARAATSTPVFVDRGRWNLPRTHWENLDAFLSAPEYPRGIYVVPLSTGTGVLPYEFYLEPVFGAPILAHFHGRVVRSADSLPVLTGFTLVKDVVASRFVPSDPVLALDSGLTLAWHAGGPGLDLVRVNAAILERLAQAWSAPRVIAWGGSAGGFSAIRVARLLANCVAFAWNPQSDVNAYLPEFVEAYGSALADSGLFEVSHIARHLAGLTTSGASFWRDYAGHAFVVQERGDWHVDAHLLHMMSAAAGRPWALAADEREVTVRVGEHLWVHVSDWNSGHNPPPQEVMVHVLRVLQEPDLDAAECARQLDDIGARIRAAVPVDPAR